jgi:hypothetical protein
MKLADIQDRLEPAFLAAIKALVSVDGRPRLLLLGDEPGRIDQARGDEVEQPRDIAARR